MQTPADGPAPNHYRYNAIIFDVGGTLIGPIDPAPFGQFLHDVGLPHTEEDARRFHDRLIAAIDSLRDKAQGLGADDAHLHTWWRDVFAQAWPDHPELAEEMFRYQQAGSFDRVFPDVMPTLEALRQVGMPMGVLSNFTSHLEDLLRRLGLRDYFDFIIVSALTRLAKPDVRIFDLAADAAGGVRSRMLYVGDHVGDDIEGARSAGLDAVLVDRRDREPDALCPRIGSLSELPSYIRVPTRPAPAIIFDMDGVVLDSMPMHLLTWQQALAPLGIDLTADDLYPLEGIPTERTAQLLTEKLLGLPCSEEEARRLADVKRTLFRQAFVPTFIPGIVPLLHDLHGRGYSLGLVTGSAGSVVDESLAPTGVLGLFDAVVTGDQVSRGKPDPEPFQTAAKRLGFSPAECLVVENAPLGILAAKAAGMRCVALSTTLPPHNGLPMRPQLPAKRVFPSAKDLRTWLLSA